MRRTRALALSQRGRSGPAVRAPFILLGLKETADKERAEDKHQRLPNRHRQEMDDGQEGVLETLEHEADREVAGGSELQGGAFQLCSMWRLPSLWLACSRRRLGSTDELLSRRCWRRRGGRLLGAQPAPARAGPATGSPYEQQQRHNLSTNVKQPPATGETAARTRARFWRHGPAESGAWFVVEEEERGECRAVGVCVTAARRERGRRAEPLDG